VRIILDAEVLSEGAFCCSFAKGSPEPIGWSNHLCNFRAYGWSKPWSQSLMAHVMGTEMMAPATPHIEPQKVRETTTVSGCSSNPEAINLGSSTFPRVLWIRNGTIAT